MATLVFVVGVWDINEPSEKGFLTVLLDTLLQNLNGCDLPAEAPSFITRVCGSGFHIPRFQFGHARRARSPQIAQARAALQRVFDCPAMSVA